MKGRPFPRRVALACRAVLALLSRLTLAPSEFSVAAAEPEEQDSWSSESDEEEAEPQQQLALLPPHPSDTALSVKAAQSNALVKEMAEKSKREQETAEMKKQRKLEAEERLAMWEEEARMLVLRQQEQQEADRLRQKQYAAARVRKQEEEKKAAVQRQLDQELMREEDRASRSMQKLANNTVTLTPQQISQLQQYGDVTELQRLLASGFTSNVEVKLPPALVALLRGPLGQQLQLGMSLGSSAFASQQAGTPHTSAGSSPAASSREADSTASVPVASGGGIAAARSLRSSSTQEGKDTE